MARDGSLTVIRQYQSETDAIREAPEPLGVRLSVLLLAGFLVALVVLAIFGHVDRVIGSVSGKIVSTEEPFVFQALDASIIKSINVKEGDIVVAGQQLATLDPTFAAADVDQLKQQVAGLQAQIARATAEQQKRPPIFENESDPVEAPYAALQRALYDQRAAALAAQMRSFDEKIGEAQATIARLKEDETRLQEREKIAQQIEDMRQKLRDSGAGSLLNLLIANDARVESLRTIEADQNGLIEAQHTLSSVAADRDATVQQWYATVSQEIVTARNALDLANSQLSKALKHQDLVRLVAPGPGMVLSIAKVSVGSVLKEGDPLITLSPLNKPLEAEIHIASRDIGFIRTGDPCTLKVDAFNSFEHGTAEGKVRWISEGAFTVDQDGKPVSAYYKAGVAIEKLKFIRIPANFRLIPGMTLTADIKVGNRSVFRYLMGGFVGGMDEAMREP